METLRLDIKSIIICEHNILDSKSEANLKSCGFQWPVLIQSSLLDLKRSANTSMTFLLSSVAQFATAKKKLARSVDSNYMCKQ